jgi:hypothetical protein
MATAKSVWYFIIVLVAWTCLTGIFTPASAETLNYKLYDYVTKVEGVPVDDVEGHALFLMIRKGFYVFENGEVATGMTVNTADIIKGSGPFNNYATITFADGSTIVSKNQGTLAAGTTVKREGEIIKGTGRFEGIKGTVTITLKYLPPEKGEDGPKGIGEGTINYTLPSK